MEYCKAAVTPRGCLTTSSPQRRRCTAPRQTDLCTFGVEICAEASVDMLLCGIIRMTYPATSDGSASFTMSNRDGCIRSSDTSPNIMFRHNCVSLGATVWSPSCDCYWLLSRQHQSPMQQQSRQGSKITYVRRKHGACLLADQ
jgi:hypothetical protein